MHPETFLENFDWLGQKINYNRIENDCLEESGSAKFYDEPKFFELGMRIEKTSGK